MRRGSAADRYGHVANQRSGNSERKETEARLLSLRIGGTLRFGGNDMKTPLSGRRTSAS